MFGKLNLYHWLLSKKRVSAMIFIVLMILATSVSARFSFAHDDAGPSQFSQIKQLPTQIDYLPFVEREIGLDRLLSDPSLKWEPKPNFVEAGSNQWVRLKFTIGDQHLNRDFIIALTEDVPRKGEFFLFDFNGQLMESSEFGEAIPFQKWQYKTFSSGHTFKIQKPGDYVFLVHLYTIMRAPFGMEIRSKDYHQDAETKRFFILALSVGGLIAMLLHNLLLWRSLSRSIFLRCSILNGLFTLLALLVSGKLTYFSAGLYQPLVNVYTLVPFISLGYFLQFSLDYLRLRKLNNRYVKAVNMSAIVVYSCGVLKYINPELSDILFNVVFTVGFLGVMFLCTSKSHRKQRHAFMLLLGMIPFALLLILWTPVTASYVSMSLRESMPVALLALQLFIGAGLASRISEMRNNLLKLTVDRANQLEALVAERTKDLDSANLILKNEIGIRRNAEEQALRQTELLKATQAKMVSSSRLTALGEMATGVSHEINNPLTILKGYLFVMQNHLELEDISKSKLQNIVAKCIGTADRMARVIRGLRDFAIQDKSEEIRAVSLKSVWTNVFGICRTRLESSNINWVEPNIDPSITVLVRSTDFAQVVLGCLTNSFDAMETTNEKNLKISFFTDNGYGVLRIEDSGIGISEEFSKNLFTPFATTKTTGPAKGLSLSIGKQLLLNMGGDIRYIPGTSTTTFEIIVKLAQESDNAHVSA
ncbi:MAG: ATP-binding protein [Proteobacteria bacterium]|nr:ATP-binding protein [Pseudomonadota bacterium]